MAYQDQPNQQLNAHDPNTTASPLSDSSDAAEIRVPQGNTDYIEEKGDRRIGKWFIKETLGKGGYSWVKRGVDMSNQTVYALKFMERRKNKAGSGICKSQVKQVETEIEVLRRVGKTDHIIRLFAYNLNQKYPDRSGRERPVILLVLEYCPGGELFDLIYYTECLEPILARTYFRQLCRGIHCLHQMGIIHRDIKPQNLLLDSTYQLKITDFGLSKICSRKQLPVNTVRLQDYRVGTRGYQAPEIVKLRHLFTAQKQHKDILKDNGIEKPVVNEYYNHKVDIFAMGVVLFIFMAGYPPFKSADVKDKWYQFIAKEDFLTFWKAHRNSGLKRSETDLISRMLRFGIDKRIDMEHIMKHAWFKGEVLNDEQLNAVLTYRHQQVELKLNLDDAKRAMLQYSEKVIVTKEIMPHFKLDIESRGYRLDRKPPPLEIKPNMMRDIYTTANAYEVLQELKKVIEDDMQGKLVEPRCNEIFEDDGGEDKKLNEKDEEQASIDIDNFCLTAAVAHLKESMEFEQTRIHVQIYWDDKVACNLVSFNIIKAVPMRGAQDKDEEESWKKKKQEMETWKKLKTAFLTKAHHVLTGLPQAQKTVTSEIEALYQKCFPKKEKKKAT